MNDTQIYISLEDAKRRLVVDGSITLFYELLESLAHPSDTKVQSNKNTELHNRAGDVLADSSAVATQPLPGIQVQQKEV